MLQELLKSNGEATANRSQVDYYAIRTKNMVGKVLTNNGIFVLVKNGNRIVRLALPFGVLRFPNYRRITSKEEAH